MDAGPRFRMVFFGCLVLFVGVPLALGLVLFFVHLCERRLLRSLTPMSVDELGQARRSPDDSATTAAATGGEFNPYEAPDALDYVSTQNRSLAALAFALCGSSTDVRLKTHKRRVMFWLSPDRRILAEVSGGTIGRIPLKQTCLFSRTGDGAVILSTDALVLLTHEKCKLVVVLKCLVDPLLKRHQERLACERRPLVAFQTATDASSFIESFVVETNQGFVERGLARYEDATRQVVRWTVPGALLMTYRTFRSPSYVERITSPGADPVPLRPGSATFPPWLRYSPWIFLGLVPVGMGMTFLLAQWRIAQAPGKIADPWFLLAPLSVSVFGLVGYMVSTHIMTSNWGRSFRR